MNCKSWLIAGRFAALAVIIATNGVADGVKISVRVALDCGVEEGKGVYEGVLLGWLSARVQVSMKKLHWLE